MSYTKNNPQPAWLNPGEVAVTLDDGSIIAVQASSTVEVTSGQTVITVTARAVNEDGSPVCMPDGSPIVRSVSHGAAADEVDTPTHAAQTQTCCLMLVLGEDASPMFQGDIHRQFRTDASIRTLITGAASAGTVDAGALL